MKLDGYATLLTTFDGSALTVRLDRPDKRNAMSLEMVGELEAVFAQVGSHPQVRAVVLCGSEGHFCAGGDVSDMARAAAQPVEGDDPIAVMNRRFGAMLQQVEASRAAVIAVCEGAVMGGGLGLACVADVCIAVQGARFRLPETSLGLPPAQIAPYLVRRLGLSQARRLAVTGETLDARSAGALGLAHHVADGSEAAGVLLDQVLSAILRCEPGALAATKALVLQAQGADLSEVLDHAALSFAGFARSDTARAGFAAFLQRKPPPWAEGSS